VKERVAVYSIVRGRPEMTKQSFQSLRDKAGMSFEHIIHDNSKHNIGLQAASNKVLELCRREGYEYMVRFDNDIIVESDDILAKLVDCCKKLENRIMLSPHVKGIVHQPERFGNVEIEGGYDVAFVEMIGGTLRLIPTKLLDTFYWDVRHPMGIAETAYLCKWLKDQKPAIPMAYIENLFVSHGESTHKQIANAPVYFAEHTCFQRYPYVPPFSC